MMNKVATKVGFLGCLMLIGLLAAPLSGEASGVTVYKDGDKYVKLGGRIQLQYHSEDEDNADTVDSVFFRRLRPYIEGSVNKDWKGKFQWDMGKAEDDNEISIKDAYMQYKGFEGVRVTLGNANFPFSRELLTSSKKQQLVERTFVGDHNYGTPDRNLGLHLTGGVMDNKLTWAASVASSSIDPDAKKLDFDTPVNTNQDFNEGWILGGRVDFHPMGYVKMEQGDFKRDSIKATIGVAAYTWSNDDDVLDYTDPNTDVSTSTKKADVDSVNGFEVSGALRGYGASIDAQYNIFKAETIDSNFTGGIYKDGETELTSFAVEGGYMLLADRVEVVAAYQQQDADNYAEEWTRTSVGANYFFKKHDVKLQLTYRMGENKDGIDDNDLNEVFVQGQYVF
jgi:hypothetical protein